MRGMSLLGDHDGGVVVRVQDIDSVRAKDALGIGQSPVETDTYGACIIPSSMVTLQLCFTHGTVLATHH